MLRRVSDWILALLLRNQRLCKVISILSYTAGQTILHTPFNRDWFVICPPRLFHVSKRPGNKTNINNLQCKHPESIEGPKKEHCIAFAFVMNFLTGLVGICFHGKSQLLGACGSLDELKVSGKSSGFAICSGWLPDRSHIRSPSAPSIYHQPATSKCMKPLTMETITTK